MKSLRTYMYPTYLEKIIKPRRHDLIETCIYSEIKILRPQKMKCRKGQNYYLLGLVTYKCCTVVVTSYMVQIMIHMGSISLIRLLPIQSLGGSRDEGKGRRKFPYISQGTLNLHQMNGCNIMQGCLYLKRFHASVLLIHTWFPFPPSSFSSSVFPRLALLSGSWWSSFATSHLLLPTNSIPNEAKVLRCVQLIQTQNVPKLE